MSKIYTRTGDKGKTAIVGDRLDKDDPRIEAIGQLDTLNAQIGYLYDLLVIDNNHLECRLKHLEYLQNLLFTLGTQLADPTNRLEMPPLRRQEITRLEEEIDLVTSYLLPLKNFILPRGHPVVSWAHVVRTTCRNTERACVKLKDRPEFLVPFLNRLSDYFFTLARYLARIKECKEVIWVGKEK